MISPRSWFHAEQKSAPTEDGILQNLVAPVARYANRDLESSALLSETAKAALQESLEKRLSGSAESAFTWFYKVFLMTPGLRTGRANELKAAFFANGVEAEILRFLATFPGLDRLWAQQIAAWQTFMADFLEHAAAFSTRLGLAKDEPIADILPDLSDPHRGGRTVLRVQFCNGQTWFYKPRSGENEQAWFGLLSWLNEKNFPKSFRILEIYAAADHCWMEAAEPLPRRDREEVASFYHRAGALLYLYHALGGIDLHCGNLIAAGAHPVIVDCETLFHESVVDPDFSIEMERSILRSGMLPVAHATARHGVSALAADEPGDQTVYLGTEKISARDFVDEIVAGFEDIHRFLHSDETIKSSFQRMVREMARLSWRKVFRPTAYYHQILQRSPSSAALLSTTGCDAELESLNEEEARSLERGDIPAFSGPGHLQNPSLDEDAAKESALLIRRSLVAH